MFNIGDKIVYPMHGAGIIESIEEKEILGQKQDYYIVRMPVGDMKVMIPVHCSDDIGIREVISTDEADKVIAMMGNHEKVTNTNWNKRYRENMAKIRSGNIFAVAEVVRSLITREREKGLSTGERKMLNSAKQILISELILAKGVDQEEIENTINHCISV